MNEQEYEKSIAEPLEAWRVAAFGEEIKAEREFSRGVWDDYKTLRKALREAYNALDCPVIHRVVCPIPDAPPKLEPIHPGAQRVVNVIANAIMESGRPLDRGLAEQIIATVRSWTVK